MFSSCTGQNELNWRIEFNSTKSEQDIISTIINEKIKKLEPSNHVIAGKITDFCPKFLLFELKIEAISQKNVGFTIPSKVFLIIQPNQMYYTLNSGLKTRVVLQISYLS